MLSADEHARAERFYFDKDRRRYVVGRGVLRRLIGRYLAVDPAEIRFAYGEQGKPELAAPEPTERELAFNISHAQGAALFAFGWARRIGVDIEPVRQLDDAAVVAERFFSAWEVGRYTAVSPEQQPQAFFNCWTRKEAYIKAIGDGLSCPLDSFDVTLTPGEPAQLLRVRGSGTAAARWQLVSLEPVPGYAAALVADGVPWQLQRWRWPDVF